MAQQCGLLQMECSACCALPFSQSFKFKVLQRLTMLQRLQQLNESAHMLAAAAV
jgi:hypothetical protein